MRARSLIPAAVLLCGCSLRHRRLTPEPAREPVVDSLFRFDESRGDSVAASGPVEGLLAFIAPNTAFLRAGVPPVYGREAARALFAAAKPTPATLAWQPLGGGVSRDLLTGYTYGVTVRRTATGPDAISVERYIAYWERHRGEAWHITAYAEIGSPAAKGLDLPVVDPPDLGKQLPKPILDAVDKVRATDSLFSDLADQQGTAFAFAANADEYGAIFGTPALVVGPGAIDKFLRATEASSSVSWQPIFSSVAGSLDLGFTIGTYTTTSRGSSGAAIQRFGKYLTVWKREADGTWKFMIEGGNAAPGRT